MKRKFLDGAIGTVLLEMGFTPPFEKLNITHSQIIKKIHQDYLDAGAEILLTHTFAATTEDEAMAAWNNIKDLSCEKFASIGPQANTELLVNFFKDKTRIVFETIYEVETAKILMSKYHLLNPIFSFSLKPNDLKIILSEFEKYQLSTIGLNCLNGFDSARELLTLIPSKYEIYFKPNSGSNHLSAQDFSQNLKSLALDFPLTYIGGCCGTTPHYVQKVRHTF